MPQESVAAPIESLSPRMLRAICMLAGGSMALLRGVYVDVNGGEHLHETINGLVGRGLAVRTVKFKFRQVRISDPRGRWFAATALARAADLLAAQEELRENTTDPNWMEAYLP